MVKHKGNEQKVCRDIKKSADQSQKFNEELAGPTSNLNNLNRVYGGMLSAMKLNFLSIF